MWIYHDGDQYSRVASESGTRVIESDKTNTEAITLKGVELVELGQDDIDADQENLSGWMYDRTDPEDHYSVGTPYEYLLYPRLPSDVYLEHIDQANTGDGESMYWVSRAFWECKTAPKSRRALEEKVATRLFYPQAAWWESLHLRCQPLNDLFSEDVSFIQKAQWWLEEAALAGYNTAKVEVLIREYPGIFIDDGHPHRVDLVSAIEFAVKKEGYPAYYEVMKYLDWVEYYKNAERERNGERKEPRSLLAISWQYAACRVHDGCNRDKARILLESHLHMHELEEIETLAVLIEEGKFTKALEGLKL